MSSIDYFLRSFLRVLTVLGIIFVSYGGVGVVADMRAGLVRADTSFDKPVFDYPFSTSGTLKEATSATESSSPTWWLLSGGRFEQVNGVGRTIQGELSSSDPVAMLYAKAHPVTSDAGTHPQNDFRLLTKNGWSDSREEITVTINDHNLSNPKNRHPWDGIDLIARYTNANTFYFASVRVDGKATIKKQYRGTYYTLKSTSYAGGNYSVSDNPTVLPENTSFKLAMETENNSDGSVSIRLFADKNNSGTWQLIAEARDTGSGTGGAVISGSGKSGIFSDYMDLTVDNYKVMTKSATGSTPTPEAPTSTSGSTYGLTSTLKLEESESGNPNWMLNSGGYFYVQNGIGKTIEGSLPTDDRWRILHAQSNARDTDNGYHPQNIFRLLTTSTWKDVEQSAYFNIRKYNLSDSPLRDAHNALLFFNRYKDGNNLYYTGIRVDGKAIIKKKLNGTYYTLASGTVFSGSYNRTSNPNLIPEAKWIGVKSVVTDNPDGSVRIRVYADTAQNGTWQLVAEATDDGSRFGAVIRDKARAGIRTDYMDVHFKDYKVREL